MKVKTEKLINDFFTEHAGLQPIKHDIINAAQTIIKTYKSGGKLLVCGNGGSSADSDHIVGELMKGFVNKRPLGEAFYKKAEELYGADGEYIAKNIQQGLPAISLTCQTALMTAFLNDCEPDLLYAQQVNALMKANDALLVISTSGNAKNVANAAKTAKILGAKVIALTGNTGGILKNLVEIAIISPQTKTYKIQEDHLPIYHLICLVIENEMFN